MVKLLKALTSKNIIALLVTMKSTLFMKLCGVLILLLYLSCAQNHKKEGTVPISKQISTDTLRVSHTYWWPQSGPFIGMCGNEYSLVFFGTVSHLKDPDTLSFKLHSIQEGSIRIIELLYSKKLEKQEYNGEQYFSSDCFYQTGVTTGDTVLVFCYDYEQYYSIPGRKSILKVSGLDDPIIRSIKEYIKAGQNPFAIKKDQSLWNKRGFSEDLNRIIECKEIMLEQ